MKRAISCSWLRGSAVIGSFLVAGLAGAQDFSVGQTIHSLQNENVAINSGVDIFMVSESDFTIDGYNVVGGANWDPNLSVSFNGSYWDNNLNQSGVYTLGDLISGNQNWTFGGFFGGMFSLGFNAPVPVGTYTATIEILGSFPGALSDILFSFEETIEVVEYGLTLSTPDTNVILPPLGSTTIRHSVQHDGTDPFLIGSRYYGWSMNGIDQFDFEFVNTYPSTLNPGDNLLLDHLNVTAHADFTTPFTFSSGFIGGKYSDDAVWLKVGDHTLTPVPEPATLLTLAASSALVALRRRTRKA